MRPRAAATLATATLVLVVAASAAHSAPQGPWNPPPVDLSATGQSAYIPRIAIAPDGTATAVWYRFNGTHNVIQAATRPPGGGFGAPVDLSIAGQGTFEPGVAVAPDGTVTAIWRAYNGTTWVIQTATRPPGGSFAPAVDISDLELGSGSPRIEVDPTGTATAVWKGYKDGDETIQAATRPPGGAFGTPVDLSAVGHDAYDPQVAAAPDGTTTVVWHRSSFVQAATRLPGGSFAAPVDLSATGQSAYEPQITTAADGTTTVVWRRSNGSNDIIQAATRPPGGSFGAPVDLSATGQDAEQTQIATASDGTTTAVWRRSDGVKKIIQAATRPPGGSFGTPVELSAGGEDSGRPQIAVAPDGTTTAVWYRFNGSDYVVQAATRPPGGSFGAPVDLSVSGQNALAPQIATSPVGTATAIWQRFDGSSNIIQSVSTELPSFLLGVAKSAGGKVTSAPAGINCGNDCARVLAAYTRVTLEATPDPDSTFKGWGGACQGAGGSICELTMTEDRSVVAEFMAKKTNLKLKKFKPKKPKLKRGKAVKVKVTAKNIGNATAKKAKLCAKPSKSVKEAIKPKGRSCQSLGSLAAGKAKTRAFKLMATGKAKKGKTYKVAFTLKAKGAKTAKAAVKVKAK